MEILKLHVQEEKARYKWLKETAFVERIPKSGARKILRNVVKEWERSLRRHEGSRLGLSNKFKFLLHKVVANFVQRFNVLCNITCKKIAWPDRLFRDIQCGTSQ